MKSNTNIYFFENDHTLIDCGMCIIIECPDNSFFIVDSGHYFQMNDNDRIYKFLRERTPENKKIIINGWLITHSHSDHTSKLLDFLKYNMKDVVIEGFYCNLVNSDANIETWGLEERGINQRLIETLDSFKDIPKNVLKTGDNFKIRNLSFDVLYTAEDAFNENITDFNDTSAVVMLEVNGNKIFIPGDASAVANKFLLNNYKGKLKCDIVQVSHHGHFGLSSELYEELNASVAIFATTRIKFFEELPRFEANRKVLELSKKHFITSDGTVKICLPLKIEKIEVLPDETFEDFMKIERLWGYSYTDEYKKELYDLFLKNGGNLKKNLLPVNYKGTLLD